MRVNPKRSPPSYWIYKGGVMKPIHLELMAFLFLIKFKRAYKKSVNKIIRILD